MDLSFSDSGALLLTQKCNNLICINKGIIYYLENI